MSFSVFDLSKNRILSSIKIIHLLGVGLCAIALLLGGCALYKDESRSQLLAAQGGVFIAAGLCEIYYFIYAACLCSKKASSPREDSCSPITNLEDKTTRP